MADGLSEDLTTDLAQIYGAPVSPHEAARAFKDKPVDARMTGRTLGVRYVLEGSLRRAGDEVRANATLVSAESGEALAMERFDVRQSDILAEQDEIGGWLRNFVFRQLSLVEGARSTRERPDNPDAFDLVLQAWVLLAQPPSAKRYAAAQALLERALRLDPTLPNAMTGVAYTIIAHYTELGQDLAGTELARADRLVTAAEAIAPTNAGVVATRAYLLRSKRRWPEAVAAYEHVLRLYPHFDPCVFMLGVAKLELGRTEEAIPLIQAGIRLDPRSFMLWSRYNRLAQALVLTGQYDEAVPWFERAMAASPEQSASFQSGQHYWLESAYALGGHNDKAHEEIIKAESISPYTSVHSFMAGYVASDAYAVQIDRVVRAGLRMAGLRDYIDEDAAGPAVGGPGLHAVTAGMTPRAIPSAQIIRTSELAARLTAGNAVMLDAEAGTRSIPGAVSVAWVGTGGTLTDPVQAQLSRVLDGLTQSDLRRPIVTLGLNAERWSGIRSRATESFIIIQQYFLISWRPRCLASGCSASPTETVTALGDHGLGLPWRHVHRIAAPVNKKPKSL